MDAEVINGLRLKNYWQSRDYYQQFRFTLPALPAADAVKEEVADAKALENKTTTRRMICERKGVDYDELIEELRQEEKDLATVINNAVAELESEENDEL